MVIIFACEQGEFKVTAKSSRIRQVALMCPRRRTRCRHLLNNIEPSRLRRWCTLCQITFTTCYLWTCPLRQLHR